MNKKFVGRHIDFNIIKDEEKKSILFCEQDETSETLINNEKHA